MLGCSFPRIILAAGCPGSPQACSRSSRGPSSFQNARHFHAKPSGDCGNSLSQGTRWAGCFNETQAANFCRVRRPEAKRWCTGSNPELFHVGLGENFKVLFGVSRMAEGLAQRRQVHFNIRLLEELRQSPGESPSSHKVGAERPKRV